MIYLGPELQNKLMPMFHYSLKPGGVLFLSPSEGIGNFTQLFSPIDRKWKFYSALAAKSSVLPTIASPVNASKSSRKTIVENAMKPINHIDLAELSQRLLVQYFAPASVLTDNAGNILYVYGETGKYLRPAPGQASLNVVEMACGDIKSELRAAMHLAAQEGKATLNREIPFNVSGVPFVVSISVRLLPSSLGEYKNLLLVSFQDVARPMAKTIRKSVPKSAELIRIKALEDELMLLEESFKTVTQEYQVTTEELKSSNEEMQSTNEEMQSSNEELETSKEELQSVNEELITVNAELQTKMDQLYDMQNDMKNLLDSINIGIIYLDKHLMIRSFTREAVRVYRLVPADIGRPLSDIRSISDKADDLIVAAQHVIDTLISYEGELRILNAWMQVRIQPYRTIDSFIDGVIITFTDISMRIKDVTNYEALRFANAIVNTIREPLLVLDGALKVIAASESFYQQFQVQPNETEGHLIYELGNHQWDIPDLRELLEEILPKNSFFDNYMVEHDFPNIGHRKMRLNARRILSKVGEPQLVLLSFEVNV
jgi:two-component system CheB/CheR fusion protein